MRLLVYPITFHFDIIDKQLWHGQPSFALSKGVRQCYTAHCVLLAQFREVEYFRQSISKRQIKAGKGAWMELVGEDVLKIVLAIIMGGIIGAEREFRNKAAGFRTILLICVGATLFTMISVSLADEHNADATRIAAQIVSGIGFLGAGVIIRQEGHIVGLTTAAVVWLSAAIGMSIGGGMYVLAGVVTGLTLVVLWVFPYFEEWIDQLQESRTYVVTLPLDRAKFEKLDDLFRVSTLLVKSHKLHKSGESMICTWNTYGPPQDHEKIMHSLFNDPDVLHFEF